MTPEIVTAIVSAIGSISAAVVFWIKSKSNTKTATDNIARIDMDREATKKNRDVEISSLRKDLEYQKENTDRLAKELEKNTNGLKEDITELKNETNARLSNLEDKVTKNQDEVIKRFDEMKHDSYTNQLAQTANMTRLETLIQNIQARMK